jgi:hypothetical protein
LAYPDLVDDVAYVLYRALEEFENEQLKVMKQCAEDSVCDGASAVEVYSWRAQQNRDCELFDDEFYIYTLKKGADGTRVYKTLGDCHRFY